MVRSYTTAIGPQGLLAAVLLLRPWCIPGLQMQSVPPDADGIDMRDSVRLRPMGQLLGKDGRCLSFLHIPKTGGTSLEDESFLLKKISSSAGKNNLAGWGKRDIRLKCKAESNLIAQNNTDNPVLGLIASRPMCALANPRDPQKPLMCSKWHFPPAWDSVLEKSYRSQECATFCVVRDPVQRAISEAGYKLTCKNQAAADKYMDDMLQHYRKNPTVADCHMLPQYEYVYGGVTFGDGFRPGTPGRYCDRVLRFENLQDEFAALMEEFGFPLRMRHANPSHCKVKVKNETIQKLQEAYAIDYETFGYKM